MGKKEARQDLYFVCQVCRLKFDHSIRSLKRWYYVSLLKKKSGGVRRIRWH